MPTTPGGSRGTASAYYIEADINHPSIVYFVLDGALRLGSVTRHGRFFIGYDNLDSRHARLSDGSTYPATVIGRCRSEDTVFLGLPAPAAAVIRCVGHFPEQGTDRSTTLTFALPTFGDSPCVKCTGQKYEGRYVG